MDSATALRAAVMFEGMLLEPMLRPLIRQDGALGDYELDAFARGIAQSDAAGFASAIARTLEGRA